MNACGIDDFHDGVNYTRTSCVIAVSKAKDMFEPFLHQVRPLLCILPCCVLGACKLLPCCKYASLANPNLHFVY